MRTIYLFTALAMLLCGCNQKSDAQAKRIAELEAQIAGITNQIADLYVMSANRKTGLIELASGMTNLVAVYGEQLKTLMLKVYALENTPSPTTSSATASAGTATKTTASIQKKNGVPVNSYNQIVADAEKKWPREYDMQVFEINNQVEAYKRLHP